MVSSPPPQERSKGQDTNHLTCGHAVAGILRKPAVLDGETDDSVNKFHDYTSPHLNNT